MIVKEIDNQVFQRTRKEGLPGKGLREKPSQQEKSFDQYLIEAFKGEVVKSEKHFSKDLSKLTRDNLIRLSI